MEPGLVVLMEDLERAVLELLANLGPSKRGEIEVRTMRALGRPIDSEQFQEVLNTLVARRLVSVTGQEVKRTEPDFPERVLEPPIETFLASDEAFDHLRLDRDFTVWQSTARGGRAGTGTWSRPDFTIATIRRRKYDPVRHLDLIAFELKNLAGSTVVAVHEALAHTRFAHYAYLVCPRSVLNMSVQQAIRESCVEHGIGLISYNLSVGPNDAPRLTNIDFEVEPRRRSPEPDQADNYIDDRFDERNCSRLLEIAGGRNG
jgi:hypothetical protein